MKNALSPSEQTRAALSPDGALVAGVYTDGKARLWDVAAGSVVRELAIEDDIVWSVAFSPDGRQLAAATSDEVVALWDVADGRRKAST